jgi:mannose-1-phosphate guanylyltransferase
MLSPATWAVVLAGGSGRRLAAITGGVPKQFYAPRGGTTLLEDTIRRVRPIVRPGRLATVIDRAHDHAATTLATRVPLGHLVRQPMDRGTAAGVLLGLSALPLRADDLCVLTPSDHGVANPLLFRRGIRRAAAAIRQGQADVVLFAVTPSGPAGDYGWVLPAKVSGPGRRLASVSQFEEKPDERRAQTLFEAGAAWNTMVLVGRAGALLELYQRHLPGLTRMFAAARALPVALRPAFLDAEYPSMPPADFSRDLLGRANGLHTFIWPAELGWTDLGTPERLTAWLAEHLARQDAGLAQPAGRSSALRAGAAA